MITTRRAELRDAAHIDKLAWEQLILQHSKPQSKNSTAAAPQILDIEKHLKQRFGNNHSAEFLIDTSPMSIVGIDRHGKIVGFAAFSSAPPKYIDVINEKEDSSLTKTESVEDVTMPQTNWATWISSQWQSRDIQLHNTKFLSYIVSTAAEGPEFLTALLKGAFFSLPMTTNISYYLPDTYPLFAPLSQPKYSPSSNKAVDPVRPLAQAEGIQLPDAPEKIVASHRPFSKKHCQAKLASDRPILKDDVYFKLVPRINSTGKGYKMYLCTRKDVLPIFRVRKARVEDTDDLVPMLRKQKLLTDDKNDFFLSNMLDTPTSSTKTLVAEADSQVVGFMSLSSDFNVNSLVGTFDVTCFDNLYKDPAEKLEISLVAVKEVAESVEKVGCTEASVDDAKVDGDQFAPTTEDAKEVENSIDPVAPEFQQQELAVALDTIEKGSEPPRGLNVFCVRLFCIEEPYQNNVLEVIKQAFNHFPDRDYCVITVPTAAVEIGHFPVIQTRIGKPESECLYVMNRFALSEPISVRKTDLKTDLGGVKNLITGMPNEAEIIQNYKQCDFEYLNTKPLEEISNDVRYTSLVALHQEQIVGIAVLKTAETHSSFIAQYEVENFIKETHHNFSKIPVILVHLIVNPLFEHQSRWFLEEIMRITAVTTLLYPVDASARRDHATLKIAKTELVPVKRRRQIQYPNNIRDGSKVLPPHDFCLQMITSNIIYEPKIIVNAKILVVGASDAGLSFLETLVYAPHLRFNNLTLISSDGIPVPDAPYVNSECFTPSELKQVGLDYYVNVIKSVTTEIDRVHKSVKLANGLRLAYDYLILTPGVQFDVRFLSPEMASINGVFGVQRVNEDRIFKAIDEFVLGREKIVEIEDAEIAVANKPNIVVYGKHLQAYTTVQSLISKGIAAKYISLVIPKSKIENQGTFDNAFVEDMMLNLCKSLGVTVYINHRLSSWETLQQANSLTAIVLKSEDDKKSSVRLANIKIFLYADEKTVDEETYRAINDSCLVFDGLFVIDKYFRTQDPSIFAAGSLCKYSSRYKTPWSHSYYNSREVGREMAQLILPIFNPVLNPTSLINDDSVLQFKDPKIISAFLPGGLTYLHFDRPRLPVQTLERRKKLPSYGRDCINSKPELNEYFRINVDPIGTIQSLTYIGVRSISIQNMCCLYGMNEKTLNRFVARFDEEGEGIPDFLSFFSEDWALPLFHDRFPEFMKRLTEDMLSSKTAEFQHLVMKMSKISSNGTKMIKESDRKVLYEYFDALPARKDWDKKLFDYLLECEVYKSYP